MNKDLKLFDYSYQATKYHWQITLDGVIVAGWSRNLSLLVHEPSIDWYEYHRDCAKEALDKIINEK